MAKTVVTSASSWISAGEVLRRIDWRTLASLCSDTDVRLSRTDLATNANLLALIADACGMIEQALRLGGRYSVADITALLADSGIGRAAVYRLVCRLVICLAYERRPDMEMKQPWIYEQAMTDLQCLRDGERILPFEETADSGTATTRVETRQDVEDRNLVTYQASRLFGRRSNRVE